MVAAGGETDVNSFRVPAELDSSPAGRLTG